MQYTAEQDRAYCNHMKQYRDTYQKIRRGEDGVWELPCKRGDIEPYSLTELCCYQHFGSGQGVTYLKRKLPEYCTMTQEAGLEIVFKFPMEKIHEVAALVGARRRMKLSPEQRAHKADMMRAMVAK